MRAARCLLFLLGVGITVFAFFLGYVRVSPAVEMVIDSHYRNLKEGLATLKDRSYLKIGDRGFEEMNTITMGIVAERMDPAARPKTSPLSYQLEGNMKIPPGSPIGRYVAVSFGPTVLQMDLAEYGAIGAEKHFQSVWNAATFLLAVGLLSIISAFIWSENAGARQDEADFWGGLNRI